MTRALILFACACCVIAGCGEAPKQTAQPAQPAQLDPTEPSDPTDPSDPPGNTSPPAPVHATINVVDLDGNALANMAPIVTRKPNAFDAPVATGSPTGPDGAGSIRFVPAERLFLRAWDPALQYFPNNFYEVLPGGDAIGDTLVIQMVPAARLDVQLLLPDGSPAANEAVALMLLHPTRGPWWPAQGRADPEGAVSFPNLPAGEYVLRFQVESGARLEREATPLRPGSTLNLGVLPLQ